MTVKMYKIEFKMDPLADDRINFASNKYNVNTTNIPIFVAQLGIQHQGLSHYTARQEDSGMFFLLLCISGNGILEYNKTSYTLNPGDIALVNANKYHRYKTGNKLEFKYFYMNLYGGACSAFESALYQNNFRILKIEDIDKTINDFMKIIGLLKTPSIKSTLEASQIVCNFLHELTICNFDENLTLFKENEMDFAINYLRSNFINEIRIKIFAKEFNMSLEHFIRKFKLFTGKTPHQYVALLRLNRAKSLLEDSKYNIAQVAQMSGFGNVKNMENCFKKEENVTPQQFRAHYLGFLNKLKN